MLLCKVAPRSMSQGILGNIRPMLDQVLSAPRRNYSTDIASSIIEHLETWQHHLVGQKEKYFVVLDDVGIFG